MGSSIPSAETAKHMSGQRLSIDATAILLAEPCYFDDEKEKAAERASTRKHARTNGPP